MVTTKRIMELLNTEPNLSANQIIEKLNLPADSAKQTLSHMFKKGRLKREKIQKEVKTKSGPQKVYVYSV
jgi:predicted ArsR family transcriptional regulator